jgi:phosphoribosylaminoimidazole carboxylase (NCAIR synthetase)
MHNLIGEDAEEWRDILAQPDLSLHLYGKLEIRPDRKMGHVTRVFPETPVFNSRASLREAKRRQRSYAVGRLPRSTERIAP